jgi:hypothetical protein
VQAPPTGLHPIRTKPMMIVSMLKQPPRIQKIDADSWRHTAAHSNLWLLLAGSDSRLVQACMRAQVPTLQRQDSCLRNRAAASRAVPGKTRETSTCTWGGHTSARGVNGATSLWGERLRNRSKEIKISSRGVGLTCK